MNLNICESLYLTEKYILKTSVRQLIKPQNISRRRFLRKQEHSFMQGSFPASLLVLLNCLLVPEINHGGASEELALPSQVKLHITFTVLK